jgi:hypothetical protein
MMTETQISNPNPRFLLTRLPQCGIFHAQVENYLWKDVNIRVNRKGIYYAAG